MIWKEIKQNGEVFPMLESVWQHEMGAASWFVAASKVWTPTFENFVEWVASCREVFGLFDGENLKMLVYVDEGSGEDAITVHLSVLDNDSLVENLSRLRDKFFHRGVKWIRGWVLKRNRFLVEPLRNVGFEHTNFFYDFGGHGKRVFRWEMMEIIRA